MKPLARAPKRLQNLLLRAQKYTFSLSWKPGRDIPLADALSRAPIDQPEEAEIVHQIEVHHIRDERLREIRQATAEDDELLNLGKIIMEGWPQSKEDVLPELRAYYDYRDELTVYNGIVYRSDRIVIPRAMRHDMKRRVHTGHLGVNSCLRRARDVIYWPGMSAEIRQYLETCGVCATYSSRQPHESEIISHVPERPWKKIATDLFTYGGRDYLITTDYHSNFFEVDYLSDTTSESVINKMKAHFARHGCPEVVVSDNGSQYTSAAFKEFTKNWQFRHQTSSPGHSQANGAAEVAVRTMKRILRKCHAAGEDPFVALLNLRNTPTEGLNTSPAQRLLGRRTLSMMPTADNKLDPGYKKARNEAELKEDRRVKGTSEIMRGLTRLNIGENVRMQPIGTRQKEWKEGTVKGIINSRSYEVQDEKGHLYRRNRRYLRACSKSLHSNPASHNCSRSRRTYEFKSPAPLVTFHNEDHTEEAQTHLEIPGEQTPAQTAQDTNRSEPGDQAPAQTTQDSDCAEPGDQTPAQATCEADTSVVVPPKKSRSGRIIRMPVRYQ